MGGAGETRSFDFERRLRQVVAGSTTTTYIYDGAGKRVAQVVTRSAQQPAATVYIGNLYEEQVNPTDLPHSAYTSYYFLGATLVGLRRANQSNSGQYRLVGDHLGSTTLLVDTSGPPTVVQRQYYTPYGTSAYQYTAHGSLTSVDFTGQRLDDSDGLLYFGARYYDAALSYFLSPDPSDSQLSQAVSSDWNRYLYVRGNPLRYADPTGYGPQDHYVFVAGCVFNTCSEDVPITTFGNYMELLRGLFDAGGWGYALASTIGGHAMSFDQWAATHVHTANVSNLDQGAARIDYILRREIPSGDFNIHLFGTSQGGAAILQYITYTLPGTASEGHGSLYQLDSRIASFITVDSPLNQVDRQWPEIAGFNLGTYLAQNTRVKTMASGVDSDAETALTIDGRDFVNHLPIDGIRKKSDPNWSDPTLLPHNQHTSHYAPNTESFFMRVWR